MLFYSTACLTGSCGKRHHLYYRSCTNELPFLYKRTTVSSIALLSRANLGAPKRHSNGQVHVHSCRSSSFSWSKSNSTLKPCPRLKCHPCTDLDNPKTSPSQHACCYCRPGPGRNHRKSLQAGRDGINPVGQQVGIYCCAFRCLSGKLHW